MNAEIRGGVVASAASSDTDPTETREWLEALDAVVAHQGGERAQYLLQHLEERLRSRGQVALVQPYSAYRNTVPLERQGAYPGDLAIEERPQGHGYLEARVDGENPFFPRGTLLRGHEFHYSEIAMPDAIERAWRLCARLP